ncbi:MAG: aconitate hydratase [Deltaproteobacteria bacterium]|nr:aconitate hydratase [Deltaproteobacteria bacterium]
MNKSFDIDKAKKIFAAKRRLLGRGLSYAEKILFLHEAGDPSDRALTPGKDQIKLYPDRVAMQDATAQMAMLQFMQAQQERTHVEATIHCDHLITADKGAEQDLEKANIVNKEIYDFLSSSAAKYGIGFWGPGSGIIHQVILENYAVPGRLMIGTDSHTPNAGGMGMLAIGVGGADAAEVMAGLPWETRYPYIVGIKLTGSLRGWATAKDVILEMLNRFTVKGGTNKIFEYFGDGADGLSVTQKATITNMGAELGATTSVFVYDDSMDAYLRNVGRGMDADDAKALRSILSQDDDCARSPEKVFSELVEIDLNKIKASHAGPFTPDRVTPVSAFKNLAREESWPEDISAVLLGSCTNSSYSDLYAAAQIMEEAGRHGLKAKVPFLLSPGSIRVYETIKRDGILDKLLQAGALILTASCGPCIGQWDRHDMETGRINCIFTTFNRNFQARNDGNPETRAFLTSPVMAACLAVSGKTGFDPETDTLRGSDGEEFMLAAPEPPPFPEEGLSEIKGNFIPPSENGSATEIKIDPASDRIELLKPFERWDRKDFIELPVLVKTRGKTTTDHISPGGRWLKYRGHITNISENMLEGALNAYTGEKGKGTNIITGEKGVGFPELARFYRKNNGGFIIMGDENYGEGSSREHAAMSPRFLGAKAVIVRSFARIHEANLKKQGILALTFDSKEDYDRIEEYDRISLVDLKHLKPGQPVKGIIKRKDGTSFELNFNHTFTDEQIEWFKAGSALNTMS